MYDAMCTLKVVRKVSSFRCTNRKSIRVTLLSIVHAHGRSENGKRIGAQAGNIKEHTERLIYMSLIKKRLKVAQYGIVRHVVWFVQTFKLLI